MARPNPIVKVMQLSMPDERELTLCRFYPTKKDIKFFYKALNRHIFNDALEMPKFEIARLRGLWGECMGSWDESANKFDTVIRINNRHRCLQMFVTVLAHEMVHQYQWEADGQRRADKQLEPLMSHGPSFFKWRKKLAKFQIPLTIEIHADDILSLRKKLNT